MTTLPGTSKKLVSLFHSVETGFQKVEDARKLISDYMEYYFILL